MQAGWSPCPLHVQLLSTDMCRPCADPSPEQPHASCGPQEHGRFWAPGLWDQCQCLLQAALQAFTGLYRVGGIGGDSRP